jgi:hypothetical protein
MAIVIDMRKVKIMMVLVTTSEMTMIKQKKITMKTMRMVSAICW